jgi:hypothetical protein
VKSQSSEITSFFEALRNGLWLFGVSCWLFGVIDRSIASFADSYLSPLETVQLFTAAFLCISWLFLKPASLKFGMYGGGR